MLALSCYGTRSNPVLVMLYGFLGNQKDWQNIIPVPCHYIVGSDDHKFLALATHWQGDSKIVLHIVKQAGHNVHLASPVSYSRKLIQILTEGIF